MRFDCRAEVAVWNALAGGTIVELERSAARVVVSVAVPLVDNRVVRLVLDDCERLWHRPAEWPIDAWDREPLEAPAAIVARALRIERAWEQRASLAVATSGGPVRVRYGRSRVELDTGAALSPAELRALVYAWWIEARIDLAPVHPALRAVLAQPLARESVTPLLAAWRDVRTSELADAIAIVDARTRGEAAVRLPDDGVESWSRAFAREPGGALAELVRCAQATFDLPLDEYTPERTIGPSCQTWLVLAACAGRLRDASPDPRIGRALEAALESPSDHWFRSDDRGFAAERTNDRAPSFADHLRVLLETNADVGSPARLRALAASIAVEADCNGAEMSSLLRELVERLASRHAADQPLAPPVTLGLWTAPAR